MRRAQVSEPEITEMRGEVVADVLGVGDASIVEPAKDAFVSAMHLTSIAGCVTVLVAAVIVVVWLPGRRVA